MLSKSPAEKLADRLGVNPVVLGLATSLQATLEARQGKSNLSIEEEAYVAIGGSALILSIATEAYLESFVDGQLAPSEEELAEKTKEVARKKRERMQRLQETQETSMIYRVLSAGQLEDADEVAIQLYTADTRGEVYVTSENNYSRVVIGKIRKGEALDDEPLFRVVDDSFDGVYTTSGGFSWYGSGETFRIAGSVPCDEALVEEEDSSIETDEPVIADPATFRQGSVLLLEEPGNKEVHMIANAVHSLPMIVGQVYVNMVPMFPDMS